MYLNKVFIYGNLTRDPELKALPSGQQLASVAVATNRVYKDKDGNKQEAVEYHNVVAFGRSAELIGQYLKKGQPIFIEGRLQTRSWETDGKKNYRTEIVLDNFQFGPKGMGGGNQTDREPRQDMQDIQEPSSKSSSSPIDYPEEEINPEDIPF